MRGVPDEVHRELRKQAAAADMSLSKYVLRELERVAFRPSVREVLERIDRTGPGPTTEQIVAAVRAGRDEH